MHVAAVPGHPHAGVSLITMGLMVLTNTSFPTHSGGFCSLYFEHLLQLVVAFSLAPMAVQVPSPIEPVPRKHTGCDGKYTAEFYTSVQLLTSLRVQFAALLSLAGPCLCPYIETTTIIDSLEVLYYETVSVATHNTPATKQRKVKLPTNTHHRHILYHYHSYHALQLPRTASARTTTLALSSLYGGHPSACNP